MRFINENSTYLVLSDEYGNVRNQMIGLICKSGEGKTLSASGLAQRFKAMEYTVIFLSDVKDEIELGFAQFEPKERYHLDLLARQGTKPQAEKVKLYHPFTFSIPKTKIPEYNFFTIPIKDLTREDWSLLIESSWDTDTIKLIVNATKEIKDNEGLYSFIHDINESIKGRKKGKGSFKPDWKNFGLPISSGTAKSIQDISNCLKPFKSDYFLSNKQCQLNINMEKVINDREHLHVFVTNFIRDKKLKEFIILALLNQIIQVKNKAKYPILLVIDEIRYLTPFKPQGYKLFLSEGISDALATLRSMGRGFSVICCSQVLTDISEEVRNSFTTTFLGPIGGASDLDKICKMYGFGKDKRDKLKKMDYKNSYFPIGMKESNEDDEVYLFVPSFCHKEPKYNFQEMYAKEFPDRLKKYDKELDLMRKDISFEENKIKEKMKNQEKLEKERLEALQREKEEKSKSKQKTEEKLEKAKEIQEKSKKELMRLIYEAKVGFNKSFRELGKEFKMHHTTAKAYFEEYEKEKEKLDKEAETKDYEDEILEELESDKDN